LPDYRHQVSQGFAGPRARFNNQVPPLFDRLLDCLGHLQLPAPEFVCGMSARQQPSGTEELVKRRCGFRG